MYVRSPNEKLYDEYQATCTSIKRRAIGSVLLFGAAATLAALALTFFLQINPNAALAPGLCCGAFISTLISAGLGLSAYLSYRKNRIFKETHEEEIERGHRDKIRHPKH